MSKNLLWLPLLGVLVAALVTPVGVLAAESVPGVTDTSIRIGGPMLITGPIAVLGTAAADGLNIYWKWVYDQGGVHGRKVECLVEDDGYDATRAVAVARKLIDRDKVFGLLTTSGTPQTLQLMPILEQEKIPSLSGIIPSFPGVMKHLPTMFTFGMPYGDQTILVIDYIVNDLKKPKAKIAFLYQDDAYGKEVKRGMDLAFKKYGLKVVAEESYKRGAIDFSTQALNLKKANPDFVILATVIRETPAFIKEADKLGWNPVCFGTSAICDEKIFELLGEKAKNLYVVNYIARAWEDVPGMKQVREVYKKYRPDIQDIQHYHILGYLNSQIFHEGLKRAGAQLTREKWVKAMESIQNFDTAGLTGLVSFAANMHSSNCPGRIFKADVSKNRWIPVTDYRFPSVK